MRPVVLYKGEAPMKEFKPTEALACNVLQKPEYNKGYKQDGEPGADNSGSSATAALLSANRVSVKDKNYAKETGDLAAGVQALSGAKKVTLQNKVRIH